ncbi:hypothetical protein Y032_0056g2722 [Ancylostoma ceylanicum]|uniref:Uncharacterized protein n=1 Tax=Ancylostoma ceylanicum TaxID=53326 RepID=A0A016U6C0_9BILA|nr:hypothetical protein Y032_0056g2722 [Ancylostoma ceylanicum]
MPIGVIQYAEHKYGNLFEPTYRFIGRCCSAEECSYHHTFPQPFKIQAVIFIKTTPKARKHCKLRNFHGVCHFISQQAWNLLQSGTT